MPPKTPSSCPLLTPFFERWVRSLSDWLSGDCQAGDVPVGVCCLLLVVSLPQLTGCKGHAARPLALRPSCHSSLTLRGTDAIAMPEGQGLLPLHPVAAPGPAAIRSATEGAKYSVRPLDCPPSCFAKSCVLFCNLFVA